MLYGFNSPINAELISEVNLEGHYIALLAYCQNSTRSNNYEIREGFPNKFGQGRMQVHSHCKYADALNDFRDRIHSACEETERNTDKKLKDRIGHYGNVE